MTNSYLAHHGIKGMHWGVRRYQNSDGSYTSIGRSRHKILSKKNSNKWNGLDDKTKKRLIKGLGTAAMVGGITAYGKAKGGTGFVGSYIKGTTAISDKMSKQIYKRMSKKEKSQKNNTQLDNDDHDNRDLSDDYDIPDDVYKKMQQLSQKKMAVASEMEREFYSKTKNMDLDSDEYIEAKKEHERKKKEAYKKIDDDFKHSDILIHHGIKGMKWGVRRFEDASGHLTPAGKRRYAIQDARKYYKINRLQRAKENTKDANKRERLTKRLRRVQTRSDRKHADLTSKDLNIGRQIVAKHRRNWAAVNTAAKTAATAAGAYALYQNPKTRALAPLAVAAGGAATFGSAKKLPYYTMEARRYKQVNPKGATTKGLTKRQKALRKAGKVAATAALAGAAAYTLHKTGADKAIIDAGKNAISSRTGMKFKEKPAPSQATVDILNANKQASKERNRELKRKETKATIVSGARKVAKGVGRLVENGISKASNAAEKRVKKSIASKLVGDVDYDDPRTWVNPVKNSKKVVDTAKRYKRAAKAVKNKDAVNAITELAPEITAGTDRLIEKSKKQVSKFRRK